MSNDFSSLFSPRGAVRFRWAAARLLLPLILAGFQVSGADSNQPKVFRFSQDSAGQGFEVALDELYSTATRGFQPIAECKDLETLHQVATASAETRGGGFAPVLYLAGVTRSQQTVRIATPSILAELGAGVDPVEAATRAGLVWVPHRHVPAGHAMFRAATASESLLAVGRLSRLPGVISVEPMLASSPKTMSLPSDVMAALQWHLVNPVASGGNIPIDVGGITNVWNNYRGKGIMISIVDSGVDYRHPDLAPHYDTQLDYDYVRNNDDADPKGGSAHGTSVAGCSAAVGDNNLGVVGVAYEASLTGIRLITGDPVPDDAMADALFHSNTVVHVSNNSWGKADSFGLVYVGGNLLKQALKRGAIEGRGGKGTIYMFAAGNSALEGSDANYGNSNSKDVISVGAISYIGDRCSYSEPGACVAISAPSGDQFRTDLSLRGILTTDIRGTEGSNPGSFPGDDVSDLDYTRQFNGTSAATPIASGVVALVLQANPNLTYRDLKEVLMRTAKVVQPSDSDWVTNSSGLHHNHQFGAGLINAEGAVQAAQSWRLLGPEVELAFSEPAVPRQVLDNDPQGAVFEFNVTNANIRVEHMTVTLSAAHDSWGDLEVTLISPKRVRSRLAEVHNGRPGYAYRNWTFSSVRHWGESAQGVWRVVVSDRRPGTRGSVTALSMNLYGSQPTMVMTGTAVKDGILLKCSAAAPGWHGAVEYSSDLRTWKLLSNVTIGNDGEGILIDRNPAAPFARFYRAKLAP